MNEIRDGHYRLGKAYLNAEQYDEAITHFEAVVGLDDSFIEAYHALALSYFGQHRLSDAREAIREALRIDETYAPALSFLQVVDPSADADVIDVSVDKADTHNPASEQPIAKETSVDKPAVDETDIDKELERGVVFLGNKQYPKAEASFLKVIKASPNHAIAHYHLAQAYMETGALGDASVEVDKALRLSPSYQPAQHLKAGIRYIAKQQKQHRRQKQLIRYLSLVAVVVIVCFIAIRYGGLKAIFPHPTPASLWIDTTLEDPTNKNGYIDAGEAVRLKLTISNQGGTAKDLKVRVSPQKSVGLRYEVSDRTFNIPQNGFETMRIPITADPQVRTKRVLLKIDVLDKYQNTLATTDVHLPTQSK